LIVTAVQTCALPISQGPVASARERLPCRGVVRRQGSAAQGSSGEARDGVAGPRRRPRREGVSRGQARLPVQAHRHAAIRGAARGAVRPRGGRRRVATHLHVLRQPIEGAGAVSDAQATTTIAADPVKVYNLVSDLPRMGEWSPENTGGRWVGGATGPAVGARFRGTNRHGVAVWMTGVTVTAADPGQRFAFDVDFLGVPISTWEYTFAEDADGCLV